MGRAVTVVLPGFAPVRVSGGDSEWTQILPESRFEAERRQICGTRGPAGRSR